MTDVTHPAEGIYLSKFMAGVASALLAAAMMGAFTNLWYLNTKTIEFDTHIQATRGPDATLPGALSKVEWEIERRVISTELRAINAKLDQIAKQVERVEKEGG